MIRKFFNKILQNTSKKINYEKYKKEIKNIYKDYPLIPAREDYQKACSISLRIFNKHKK